VSRVTIHEAKTNLSKLIAEVEAGGEVIIIRRDKPVVRLAAEKPERPVRVPGRFAGQFEVGPEFFDPLPEEDLRLWNCEGDEDPAR
jgi:antitoxin (DNA-binding transcriptional repressor) of toxin-antitoxin stability system